MSSEASSVVCVAVKKRGGDMGCLAGCGMCLTGFVYAHAEIVLQRPCGSEVNDAGMCRYCSTVEKQNKDAQSKGSSQQRGLGVSGVEGGGGSSASNGLLLPPDGMHTLSFTSMKRGGVGLCNSCCCTAPDCSRSHDEASREGVCFFVDKQYDPSSYVFFTVNVTDADLVFDFLKKQYLKPYLLSCPTQALWVCAQRLCCCMTRLKLLRCWSACTSSLFCFLCCCCSYNTDTKYRSGRRMRKWFNETHKSWYCSELVGAALGVGGLQGVIMDAPDALVEDLQGRTGDGTVAEGSPAWVKKKTRAIELEIVATKKPQAASSVVAVPKPKSKTASTTRRARNDTDSDSDSDSDSDDSDDDDDRTSRRGRSKRQSAAKTSSSTTIAPTPTPAPSSSSSSSAAPRIDPTKLVISINKLSGSRPQ